MLCKDYICSGTPDLSVSIAKSDIDFEREKSVVEHRKKGLPIRNFSDSYLETLAVYRKIADQMLEYDTILFHGSVIAVDGVGYLFAAKSGIGKSTHAKLWRKYFGERVVMINDDKPLLYVGEDHITAYGTPWNGKHRLSTNTSVPLKAICILERSRENHIERISKSEAYLGLLQQTNRPFDVQKMQKTLHLLDKLSINTALYKLNCNMELEAAEVAYNGMKG